MTRPSDSAAPPGPAPGAQQPSTRSQEQELGAGRTAGAPVLLLLSVVAVIALVVTVVLVIAAVAYQLG